MRSRAPRFDPRGRKFACLGRENVSYRIQLDPDMPTRPISLPLMAFFAVSPSEDGCRGPLVCLTSARSVGFSK